MTAPPYPSHLAVRGTAAARAAVLYGRRQLDLVNLGDQPWAGGRVWLNGRYSAHLPRTAPGGFRHYGFALFLDADGNAYPGDVTREPVESIELQFGDELTRRSGRPGALADRAEIAARIRRVAASCGSAADAGNRAVRPFRTTPRRR